MALKLLFQSRLVLGAALLWGCSSPSGNRCIPGQSAQCGCINGSVGAQVCEADGTFAPCVCEPGAPDSGEPADSGVADAGTFRDAGVTVDSGTSTDGGTSDAGQPADSGVADGGMPADAGFPVDSGSNPDGGPGDAGLGDAGPANPCSPQSGVTVLATGNWDPYLLAANSTGVYWITSSNPATVFALPFASCTPVAIGQDYYSLGVLVADEQHLYWSGMDTGNAGYVVRALLDGGATTTLVDDPLGVDAFAVDTQYVYWADSAGIYRSSLDGGAASSIAYSADPPWALVVDPTTLYWSVQDAHDGGMVWAVPIDGGGPPRVLSQGLLDPMWLSVTSTDLYVSCLGTSGIGPYEGSVVDIQLGSGYACAVSAPQPFPGPVVTDSAYVYWIAGGLHDEPLQTCTPNPANVISSVAQTGPATSSAGVFWGTFGGGTGNIFRFSW